MSLVMVVPIVDQSLALVYHETAVSSLTSLRFSLT